MWLIRHKKDLQKKVKTIPTNRFCFERIADYYGGKRMEPGELTYDKDLTIASSYKDKTIRQRELYLIWIEIRRLKTHPALLIPRWTGFNITVRKKLVASESAIGYLDTLDSPATDL